MQAIIGGSACSIAAQLDPLADAGSVLWTLRGNSGSVVAAGQVPIDGNTYRVAVPVSVEMNTKLLPTESRFMTFEWLSAGQTNSIQKTYILVDFMPLRVSTGDVRASVGANVAELPDVDIDIISAAMEVRENIGGALFDATLVAGTTATTMLNSMVALWAAATFVTSLPLRITASMSNEQAKFSRSKIDSFPIIIQGLRDEYERLRNILSGIEDTQVKQIPIFCRSFVGVDPIRGALSWSNFPAWYPYSRV